MKTLVTLLDTPIMPGAEATVLTDVPTFQEKYVGEVYINDSWWGTIPLVVEPYDEAIYDAYDAAAPPAWGHIMFNADLSGFKIGAGMWWGVLQAYVLPIGA